MCHELTRARTPCVCYSVVMWSHSEAVARKIPLRKPNHGEGIVSTKPRPKSVYDFLGSVIVSLFCCVFVLSSGPT